jgi:hypothetical protein
VYIFALSTDNFRKAIKMINLGGSGQSVHRRMASSVASAATAYALNYTIELSPYDATRPYFAVKTIPITVSGDTAFAVDLERILKSPQVSALSDVNVKEDIMPQDHHLVDMWGKAIGYDSSANPVDPSQLAFAVDNISPQGKAYFSIQDNRYITLDSLAHDANGTVIANVKTTAPNGKSTTVPLKLVIAPMTDL